MQIGNLDNWPERHLFRVISSHDNIDIESFENNSPYGCLTQNMNIDHFGRFPKVFVFLAKLVLKFKNDELKLLTKICQHSNALLFKIFYQDFKYQPERVSALIERMHINFMNSFPVWHFILEKKCVLHSK